MSCIEVALTLSAYTLFPLRTLENPIPDFVIVLYFGLAAIIDMMVVDFVCERVTEGPVLLLYMRRKGGSVFRDDKQL